MRVLWVSANILGLEMLKEVRHLIDQDLTIMTLSEDSRTVMYDGVKSSEWYKFNSPVEKVNRISECADKIKKINPDLIIMCGWRQIINKEILSIPKLGWVGFHPTLLPKGRGPAPIINSILEGWKESGVTMFYLSEGLDDGDIIGQESFPISDNDHAMDVYEKVIDAGKKLARHYVPLLINRTAPRHKQNELEVTFFKKPRLKDNEINFNSESSEEIYRKIKALSRPYSGAYVKVRNNKIIIWRASKSTF
jgi:methionyl-tRNA formyltransferase